MSLGLAAGTSKPMPREHLHVERGGHRDLGGEHAVDGGHVAAHLEERDRVGVRAGAQLDVRLRRRAHAAFSIARVDEGVPRAPPQPGAGRVPDRHQGRGGGVLGRRAEGGDVRRELRQHLAVQRAVEQGGREQGGPVESGADGGRHVVGQAVGRDEHGQPAAEDVVAERRQAAAVADERVQQPLRPDVRDERGWRAASPRCGRSGGPRLRNRRARRPKDSAEIDSGHANIHESSDAEGVAGQIQGPALNIGAGGAGGENYLGRHARDLRAAGAGRRAPGRPRERRRRRSGRPPRRTGRRATGAAPGPVRPVRSAGARRRVAVRLPTTHQGPRFPTLSAAVTFDRCEVVPTIPEEAPQVLTARSRA